MMRNKFPIRFLLALVVMMSVGCAAPQILTTQGGKKESRLDTGVAQCKISKDVQRPMLVEWPAVEKTALQSSAKREIVVVRYDGCRLRRVSGCRVAGSYEFTQTSRSKDGFVIRDKTELFTKLPLGAVSLEGELSHGKQLALSYVAVGTRTANISLVDDGMLEGNCEGATHFVSSMVVGAYELAAESGGSGGVSVKAGVAGGGGKVSSEAQVIRADGDLKSCSSSSTAADHVECQAVVQLVLEPIQASQELADIVAAVAAADAAEEVPVDEAAAPVEEEPKEEPPAPAPEEQVADAGGKGLSPVPFWVMGGVTAALGIGTLVVDFVVQDAYETAENDPLDQGLKDDVTTLQAVEWALLGTAAASLVTTVVLAFFTDFKKEKGGDETARRALVPVFTGDGGMLMLEGRF